MMDCNNVIICGTLVRDPKSYPMKGGSSVASFSLATTREWASRDGTVKKKTAYPNCKAWGTESDTIMQYKKGDRIALIGMIETGSYERNGQKVYTTEVRAEKIWPFAIPSGMLAVENYGDIYDHAALAANDDSFGDDAPDADVPF